MSPQPHPRRLTALRALGLGDLLVAVPALRALAVAFPTYRRILIAPASLSPLVAMLGNVITDITHADFRHRVGAIPVRASDADIAVNLHGKGPHSHRALLDSGARRVIGYAHPLVDRSGPPEWRPEEHEMLRWCRLLNEHGIPADPGDWRIDPGPWVPVPAGWDGAVVVHPGAASGARRWPTGRWVGVVRELAARGMTVVISGSHAERPGALDLARRAGLPDRAVRAGRTSLAGLAAGLSRARLLVSGDTGVGHLGSALGTPSVLLFGPTSPARWGPPPDQDGRHLVLWGGSEGDPHADDVDAGLLTISIDDVLDGADSVMGRWANV